MPLQSHLSPLLKGLIKTKGDFRAGCVLYEQSIPYQASSTLSFVLMTDPDGLLPYLSASFHPLFYIDFRVKNEKHIGSVSYFDFFFESPYYTVKMNVFTDEKPLLIEAVKF